MNTFFIGLSVKTSGFQLGAFFFHFCQGAGGFAGHGRGDPSKLLLRLGVLAVVFPPPNFRGDSEGKSEAAVEASDKTP